MPREEDYSMVAPQVDWAPARLRELRESAGFSRQAVADAMGVNVKRIADIELARYSLRLSTVCRFLQVIGVSIDQWVVGCPGAFDRKKIPTAVQKGEEVRYLVHQMKKLDDEQLKEFAAEVREEAKTRKAG